MVNLFKTKKVKTDIDQSPGNYQAIINGVTEYGICITDQYGQYLAINDRYSEITGYLGPELHGKHFSIVVPDQDKSELNELHNRFIKEAKEISRIWVIIGKDGTPIKINVDARHSDKINGQPHKITFIEPMG